MSQVDLTLAHWIRDRRHALGLTQTALGGKCGVPQPIVSRWEQGVRIPHDRHMAALCQVLGDPPASVPPAPIRRVTRSASRRSKG